MITAPNVLPRRPRRPGLSSTDCVLVVSGGGGRRGLRASVAALGACARVRGALDSIGARFLVPLDRRLDVGLTGRPPRRAMQR